MPAKAGHRRPDTHDALNAALLRSAIGSVVLEIQSVVWFWR